MTDGSGQPTKSDSRQRRAAARLAAVQALYQMELVGTALKTTEVEFENRWIGAEIEGDQYHAADIGHFRALLRGAVAQQIRIDHLTNEALVARWPLGRIDPTLRALFRAAGAELILGSAPPKVTITEFVDVAKAFFDAGREAKFVNAVLDHMARVIRPEAFQS